MVIILDVCLISLGNKMPKDNPDQYIKNPLTKNNKQVLKEQLIISLSEDAQDPEYKQEIQEWDGVVGDGINEEEFINLPKNRDN